VFGLELFGAEPAAHIGKPNVHPVTIEAEHRRDLVTAAEGVLDRRSEF
jgi:hypothetical protein